MKRPDLPASVANLVDRMLARNPADRFASPQEVADALLPLAAGANLTALLARATVDQPNVEREPNGGGPHGGGPQGGGPMSSGLCTAVYQPAAEKKVSGPIDQNGPQGAAHHLELSSISRRWWANRRDQIIAAALGGIFLLGTVVLYFKTGSGTIVVEIDDPTIQVTVEGEELKITKDQSGDAYQIKPGEKTLHVTRGDLRFDTDKFELRRGETVVLAVKLVDGQAQVKRGDGPDARVIGRSTLPTEATDRTAAVWALSIGGSVTLDVDGKEVAVNAAKDLPPGTWKVRSITVPYATQVTDADLKELAGLKQLLDLELNNSRVTDVGLKELPGLRQLQSLSLSGAKVTNTGLKELAGLKQLQSLNLDNTQVTDAGLKELAGLGRLQSLSLWNAKVTDAGLKELAGLKQLQVLHLAGTRVTDTGLKELAGLTQLRDLNLSGTQVTDTGLQELAGLKQLQGLSLIGAPVTGTGFKELAGLTQLKALWLGGIPATDAGLKELARLKQLQVLALFEIEITDAVLKDLAGLTEMHALLFNSPKVTDAGLKELAGLTRLGELRVYCPNVTDAGLKELAKLKQLSTLGLNNTQVTDAGLKELAGIKQLKGLFLDDTHVTDAGLKEIAGFKNLQNLYLNGDKVTETGIAELKKALPGCQIQSGPTDRSAAKWVLSIGGSVTIDVYSKERKVQQVQVKAAKDLPPGACTLRTINLSQNIQVTDAGLRELAGLTKLQELYLDNTPVTDAGLKELAGLKQLKHLDLRDTKVTDTGVAELKKELRGGGTQIKVGFEPAAAARLPAKLLPLEHRSR